MPARELTLDMRFQDVVDNLTDYVNELLQGYEDMTPISGALTVSGHEYWVVLEYGSSPAERNPGPSSKDFVELNLPANVPDLPPNSAYPESKHHTKWYKIKARHAKWLVFIDEQGRFRKEEQVTHPGIRARGFIRRAVQESFPSLFKGLDQLEKELDDELPSRKDIVKVFNYFLGELLARVQESTPVGDSTDKDQFLLTDDEAGHLRDAWNVVYAR